MSGIINSPVLSISPDFLKPLTQQVPSPLFVRAKSPASAALAIVAKESSKSVIVVHNATGQTIIEVAKTIGKNFFKYVFIIFLLSMKSCCNNLILANKKGSINRITKLLKNPTKL